jgi:IMP dehydrogenase
MAQAGGIGVIHRNMSIKEQVAEVGKVKKSESGMIVDPITMEPDQKVYQALEIMSRYRISGVPIVRGAKLVGILTNRDLRFEKRLDIPVSEVMTKENLITVAEGTTLEEAKDILHKNRIEKLLVVDDEGNLKGLITIKDIEKAKQYPFSCKDQLGRLRCRRRGKVFGRHNQGAGRGRGRHRLRRGPWPGQGCFGDGPRVEKEFCQLPVGGR